MNSFLYRANICLSFEILSEKLCSHSGPHKLLLPVSLGNGHKTSPQSWLPFCFSTKRHIQLEGCIKSEAKCVKEYFDAKKQSWDPM